VRVVVADRKAVERHEQPFGRRNAAAHDQSVPLTDSEPGAQQRLDAVAPECVVCVVAADWNLQEEQPDRVAERRVRQAPVEDRDVGEACRRAVVAEQLDDRLLGVREPA